VERGQLSPALRTGVVAGAVLGLIHFALGGSTIDAIVQGIGFGLFFGLMTAFRMRRGWPGSEQLQAADRAQVSGIVQRGDEVEDARLAPAVLTYVAFVRRKQEDERRQQWVLWLFSALTVAWAVTKSFGGSTRQAVVSWALVALWAVILVVRPHQQARRATKASRAEAAAQRALQRPPSG